MGIPKQVEEAEELALELHKQMNAPEEKEDEKPIEEEQQEEQEQEAAQKEEVEEINWREKYEKLEQTHKTLKGKYDAEVPRLHKDIKEFKESVYAKIGDLTKQPEPKAAPDPDEAKLAKFKEEYGEEMLEAQRILARKEAEAIAKSLLAEKLNPVQEQVQSVETAQLEAAKSNFTGFLDNQVKGDWRALWNGQNEQFNEFLSKPDPSGFYTYGQLAEMFNENWEGEKLAHLFNTFIASTAPPKIEKPVKPAEKAPNPAQEARIAPSRQTNHSQPAAEDKRIWTKASMDEFYKLDRMGKYTQEESVALWNDLWKAASENRIRG